MPVGATVHTCSTSGCSHSHTSAHFIQEAQLAILAQLLLEKAVFDTPNRDLINAYLSALLRCAHASWNTGFTIENLRPDSPLASTEAILRALRPKDAQSLVLERACRYIASNLPYAMSPALIARHSFVSPSQLKRIFREQLDMPVMKYVAERRLEEAKVLLRQTNLTTVQIGEICGYRHRTHFSRAFKNHTGSSPQTFRQETTTMTGETCIEAPLDI
jgi:AraC-like DNA-binding protein